MDLQEPVEIYRAGNIVQAHLIASALEDAGIKTVVIDEVPVYLPPRPQIMVSQADAARARELLERMEQGETPE